MARKDYCVIRVDGIPRKLFSVEERSGGKSPGDLIVSLAHAEQFHPSDNMGVCSFAPDEAAAIKGQKYSVHRSLKSEHGVNTLKHTLLFADGRPEVTTRTMTFAVKRGEGKFAGLYTAVRPNMREDRYSAPGQLANPIDLGEYDPKLGQLFLSVCVGAPDAKFDVPKSPDFRVVQRRYEHFSVVVVFSFSAEPSDERGLLAHFHTPDPNEIERELQPVVMPLYEGLGALDFVNQFRVYRLQFMMEKAQANMQRYPKLADTISNFLAYGFFGTPRSRAQILELERRRQNLQV